jgi:predicted RNA binding protein YcfA (HicA-like mRNA interferase family)
MSRAKKTLDKILRGGGDANISFRDFRAVVEYVGFELDRVSGSHFIYHRDGIPDIINIQAKKGKAKPRQVEQVRDLIIKHGLALTIYPGGGDDQSDD